LARLEITAKRCTAALPLQEQAIRIFGELVVKAPGVAQWKKDKEQVESELARCRSMALPNNPGDVSASQHP
jgi:hypothetical protein